MKLVDPVDVNAALNASLDASINACQCRPGGGPCSAPYSAIHARPDADSTRRAVPDEQPGG
ncbi:hypothetical protein BN2475_350033 [Paraburkholderia ribeironis]|uniref:Uncharacterized protein n=1 Tax=Paraburkholderia ribeironis TaxID=1247936 RepID=A0A1N7S4L7_9BURK|nr:hypothetical protein BN2475_350033 [Paraburkholderia ribeironis]